jgi:hypothetical protein
MDNPRQEQPGPVPAPVFLDASILDDAEEFHVIRDDVQLNRIEFVFPSGFSKVDLLEECRALCDIENFDVMYDLTMQMLSGRDLAINIKNDDGSKTCLDQAHITDKMMDMRSIDAINEWPCLMNWLVEFIGAMLSRNFPMPGASTPRHQALKNRKTEPDLKTP